MQDCRVCVVDDCVDDALILCEGLKLNNYKAIPAYNGSDALDLCLKERFDLLLLDSRMPDIDGFEVCRRLKASPQTRDIGVIFVTAKGEPQDIALGKEMGALDYITKPFNLPMVMVRVDAALRHLQALKKQRSGEMEALADDAYTDDLTGLRNRRYLMERLLEEVEKAHRYDYPIACLAIDVDEAQPIDDELGPVSLDDLLVEVGMTLRNYSRTYDIVARYDNTLFAAILPHADHKEAVGYARTILGEIDATTFSDPNFPTKAQLRIGIAAARNAALDQGELLLGEAMRGLFEAKSHPNKSMVLRNIIKTE